MIPKEYSEAVNDRKADNSMVNKTNNGLSTKYYTDD